MDNESNRIKICKVIAKRTGLPLHTVTAVIEDPDVGIPYLMGKMDIKPNEKGEYEFGVTDEEYKELFDDES